MEFDLRAVVLNARRAGDLAGANYYNIPRPKSQ